MHRYMHVLYGAADPRKERLRSFRDDDDDDENILITAMIG